MFTLRLENVRPPLFSLARVIARAALPASARAWLYRLWLRIDRARRAWDLSTPMIIAPTYADDGLISQHVCDFLTDERFIAAYAAGRAGISWTHPGEIQFRAHVACWAAQHAVALDGDLVECGVCNGILARTICSYLDFASVPKRFFLFDTFKGIPIETLTDAGEIALARRLNEAHYATDFLPFVRQRFSEFANVVIVPGILPNTLQAAAPERIAYLSIDLNNAPAEIATITYLWDRLVPAAIVLLDDYAYGPEYTNQRVSWDKFCGDRGVAILTLPTGQGMLIKPASP